MIFLLFYILFLSFLDLDLYQDLDIEDLILEYLYLFFDAFSHYSLLVVIYLRILMLYSFLDLVEFDYYYLFVYYLKLFEYLIDFGIVLDLYLINMHFGKTYFLFLFLLEILFWVIHWNLQHILLILQNSNYLYHLHFLLL